MCGIVGAVAKRPVAKILINGLKKLEYRGYDSAGLAVIDHKNQIERLRVAGKVRELEASLIESTLFQGHTGIAHTRWATHGAPSEKNAHPFVSHNEFALVHNGIIENHFALRDQLVKEGYEFNSDTDTEVVVHLIHYHYSKHADLLAAIRKTVQELKGAFALGIISIHDPHRLIAVRQGSPLVIGIAQGENFLASDPLALLSVTNQFVYLEDNDIADIRIDSFQIFAADEHQVTREIHTLSVNESTMERGEFRHFMQKEIREQPAAIAACLLGRLSKDHLTVNLFGKNADKILEKVKHVQLVACGTSYHAAMVAKYWIESLVNIPCSVEVASEYRYRDIAEAEDSLFVTLSQSGETADTLAALRLAKKMHYLSTLVICNVPGSTMMREADLHFLTQAGVEIGVASTKAFVTQLVALFLFTLNLRSVAKKSTAGSEDLISDLHKLSAWVQKIMQQESLVTIWAKGFISKQHAIFLGRGFLYPIALEGALKMKEISYIHAEGYPAGELKHGPLALVDSNMPVIAMAPSGHLFEKTLSNLQEVRARGGKLYVLTDQVDQFHHEVFADANLFEMPVVNALLTPILYTIPLQLLAYHVAVLKGTDVDQPRNLAKSVTVE